MLHLFTRIDPNSACEKKTIWVMLLAWIFLSYDFRLEMILLDTKSSICRMPSAWFLFPISKHVCLVSLSFSDLFFSFLFFSSFLGFSLVHSLDLAKWKAKYRSGKPWFSPFRLSVGAFPFRGHEICKFLWVCERTQTNLCETPRSRNTRLKREENKGRKTTPQLLCQKTSYFFSDICFCGDEVD